MSYQLTIIIPVFNEEGNLLRVEQEFIEFLKVSKVSSKVMLINDGSKDTSQNLIEKICQRNQDFQFLTLDKNRGLSTALKAGIDNVNTPLIGYIDADLQTSPMDFNILLDYIDNYQLVNGFRRNRKDSFVKNHISKIANAIRHIFTNDGVHDSGCPLKIIHTDYAKRIPMFIGLHRFLPAMILLQGGKVFEVPVSHFKRITGKSKYGLINRLFNPLVACFAFLWIKRNYIRYTVTNRSDFENKLFN